MKKRVPAREVLVGDDVEMDGGEAHCDLAGLLVGFKVVAKRLAGSLVWLMPDHPPNEHWWRLDELVTVYRTVPGCVYCSTRVCGGLWCSCACHLPGGLG